MIYRKRIPQWTERFGVYHDVWFYTKKIMYESVGNYRKMEKVPDSVQEEFDNNASAVIQDRKTEEILKSYAKV